MISVIIPSYNQEQYLPNAIDSALEQTAKCEVIVIDDGSTDNSLEIAKRYKSKVKIISQVNKGLASARNTGIMNASGNWILPLDADDILLENCIEEIEKAIEQTNADIIAPSIKTFGTSSQQIILMPDPKLEDFKLGNRLAYCSAIKREKLLEIGGYSPRMKEGYEDLHCWINLLSRGARMHTIPQVLVLYRTKEQSMWKEAVSQHHQELMAQIRKDFPQVELNF